MTDIPVGYCGCGCGAKTSLAKTSSSQTGRVKGAPLRYLYGHHRRKSVRYGVVPAGYRTPCWVWSLARNPKGYGVIADGNGGCALAHRVYYQRARGPIPKGRQIDHLCRMPPCVNPDHLEVVTPAENVRRGAKTKLTIAQVAAIRASNERQSVLARRYGIGQSQVSRIKRALSWRIHEEPAVMPQFEPVSAAGISGGPPNASDRAF